MQIDELERQWTDLCRHRSAAKKFFDPDHPLELLFGADPRGRAVIALITSDHVDVTDLSRDVSTTSAQREDGKWATTWTLTDSLLLPTFIRLGADVASRSKIQASDPSPMESFFEALAQWQLLLRPKPPKRLTLERLRGLVGELWAGEEIIANGRALSEVVQAWSGPRGGVQDFNFPSGEAWEVKTKRTKANTVQVSSAEQLEAGDKDLRLVVMDLDEGSADVQGARSLVDLVRSYRTALAAAPLERHMFDVLVAGLGVDLGDTFYTDTCFILQSSAVYVVDDLFPCVRSAGLPSTVTRVRYDLDIRGLKNWSIDPGEGRE